MDPRSERSARRKRGIALIWMAIGMAPLMGLTGLALDMGNVALMRSKLQSYADAKAISSLKERFGGLPRQVKLEDYIGNAGAGKTQDADVGIFSFQFGDFKKTGALTLAAREVPARKAFVQDFPLPLILGPIVGVPSVNLSVDAVAYLGRRQVVIVQDLSGSMSQGSRLPNAKSADQRVIQEMESQQIAGDQVGLVAFDNALMTKQGLTNLAGGGAGNLDGIVRNWNHRNGGTNVSLGIKEGASLYPEPHDADVERILIVVGDGEDCEFKKSVDEVNKAAARGIHVFTIMITGGQQFPGGAACDNGGGPEKYFAALPRNRGVYKPSPNGSDLSSLLVSIVAGIPLRLVQ